MQFSDWSEMFNAFVDSEKIPAKFKMIYMKNYLAGEPLRIVERYRPTETGYAKAKEELDKKYGGKMFKIRNELDSIRRTRPIQVDETKRLEEFSDRVTSLVTNLKESGCVSDLTNTSAYYLLVVEKLHHFYVKNYNRWLSTEHREDNFESFAEWLTDEALFEKRAKQMTQTTSSMPNTRHQQRKTFRVKTQNQHQPAVRQSFSPPSDTNCMVCQADHALESCAVFQSWTVGKRYEFCKQTRICFRCLAGQHRGIRCHRFPGCQLEGCGGSHHTLLHASLRQDKQLEQRGRLKEQHRQTENTSQNRQTTSHLPQQGQLEQSGQLSWSQYRQEGAHSSGCQPSRNTPNTTSSSSSGNTQSSGISYNTAASRSPPGKGATAFTPPGAPHFNGACEAMIKCAKRALKRTLERADLTDEELQTAFCRAEALLNTRPITVVSADANDEKPLTPADFILGTASIETSPASQDDATTLRQRWKRLQQLSIEFWKRWLREYVPALQAKSKWLKPQTDLKSGDLVLVIDANTPRSQWPLGRIEEVLPGKDGHVRVATVKLHNKVVTRPVVKLIHIDVLQ
ncbi:uncharacterized protein LOC122380185 [Amphibalanus amphitrite]|nr:uncharacterized protein LOC122380185 [Amphibalanus amphitrite]